MVTIDLKGEVCYNRGSDLEMTNQTDPEANFNSEEDTESHSQPFLAPIPSSLASSILKPASYLTFIPDERAIPRLLERLLEQKGLSISQAARQFGIRPGSLHQYLSGRRLPGLLWFLKFCAAMDATVEVKVTKR
jgi:hypothetical protein